MTVYGYLRVSTDEQARSGLGLDAQRETVEREARYRDWRVTYVTDDGYSAKTVDKRPGLSGLLAGIGRGDVLVVAKLDRLSRSVVDFAGMMGRAQAEGWSIVLLDLGVDMTTPAGRMVARMMASFAEYERELIATRTSDALQAAKRHGRRVGIGSRTLDAAVRARIVELREAGMTYSAIADTLNAEGVPTARGGRQWYPSSVRAAWRSDQLDKEAARLAETA